MLRYTVTDVSYSQISAEECLQTYEASGVIRRISIRLHRYPGYPDSITSPHHSIEHLKYSTYNFSNLFSLIVMSKYEPKSLHYPLLIRHQYCMVEIQMYGGMVVLTKYQHRTISASLCFQNDNNFLLLKSDILAVFSWNIVILV